MKIYCATGQTKVATAASCYMAGCRNVLVSFADISQVSSPSLGVDFWISRERRDAEMKLYIAGNVKGVGPDEADYAAGVRNRLLSYAFVQDWAREAFAFWVNGKPDGVSVFLDSGAFSAMSRGSVIDLSQYCDYIEEHKASLACYAALDVIKDWRASRRNLDAMVARGLMPVPCFHRGSPWEELDSLASEYPYIALGGMVGTGGAHDSLTQKNAGPYLDECFLRLEKRWPVKVHLFGVVAQWVMERYPLYSADSATAIMGAGMGRVQRFYEHPTDVDRHRRGILASRGWTDDVASLWDGAVADGVGRSGPKSQSAHPGRRARNIESIIGLQQEVTDHWAARGVTWE